MDEKTSLKKDVPYIVYEAETAKAERHLKRILTALIISIILLFTSNALWLYAWCQYDYASYELISDEGNASLIGNDGDIHN